jgi:uncharacterized protein (TIGR02757 family)
MVIPKSELKDFLDEKYDLYNRPNFIESDPISIPHSFSKKEDIEIIAFLAATIAWGQRVTIINNARKLADIMGNNPHEFVLNADKKDLNKLIDFKHRTFNGIDAVFFIQSLQNIYRNHNGLEAAFCANAKSGKEAIINFRETFFSIDHPKRTGKHVSNPASGSSAKRLNMFLRWMVRNDKRGVDFGIWTQLSPALLSCPLDVHTGNVGRKLGLIKRTQNDWKAVDELDSGLRKLDPEDPVKYDFALFGLGVFEGF